MSTDNVLLLHGTKLMQLKPVNIVQAAAADLRLLERKREDKADDEQPYTFHRRHVHRARNIPHLVALAYFEPVNTDKRSTLIVYGDLPLLRETLIQLLQGEEAA